MCSQIWAEFFQFCFEMNLKNFPMCSHSPDSYKTEAAKSEMTFAFMVFYERSRNMV